MSDACARLFLVPEDVLDQWRSRTRLADIDQPRIARTVEADGDVTAILNEAGMSDYDKNALVEQKTASFRQLHDNQNLPLSSSSSSSSSSAPPPHTSHSPPSSDDLLEQHIIDTVPKSYAAKARLLYNRMKSDPSVSWDETHGLSIGGQPVSGSNVAELIRDAVGQKKGVSRPAGYAEARDYFLQSGVPRSWLGNKAYHTRTLPAPPPLPPTSVSIDKSRGFVDTPRPARGRGGRTRGASALSPLSAAGIGRGKISHKSEGNISMPHWDTLK